MDTASSNINEIQNRRRLLSVLSIASFICLIPALVIINNHSPASGYELSTYDAFPIIVWVLIGLSMSLGIIITISEAFSKIRIGFWKVGLIILMIVTAIIVLLPIIRGYYLVGYPDPFGHLNYTNVILDTGHFNTYYPMTHLVAATLTQSTGLSPEIALEMIPIFLTIIAPIFIFCLARVVTHKNLGYSIIAAIIGTIPLYTYYHVSVYPQTFALFLFPIFFFIYFKYRESATESFTIPIILFLIVFVFIHPFIEIILIICLLVGDISDWVWGNRADKERKILRLSFVSFLIFFSWYVSFAIFDRMTGRFLNWLNGNILDLPRSSEVAITNQMDIGNQLLLIMKLYGGQLILLAITAIGLIIILSSIRKRESNKKHLFVLSSISLSAGLAYLLVFTATISITIGRLLGANTMIWVMPIFSGLILFEFGRKKRLRIAFVVMIILFSSILSIFAVYRSPWVLQPNTQVTQEDIEGLNWYSQVESQDFPIVYLGWPERGSIDIPQHFGYENNTTLGKTLGNNTIIYYTSRFDLMIANEILAGENSLVSYGLNVKGFNQADIERLQNDTTVNRIFSNGVVEIYFVYRG